MTDPVQSCSQSMARDLAGEIEDSYSDGITRDLLISKADREMIVAALRSAPAASTGEPVAWQMVKGATKHIVSTAWDKSFYEWQGFVALELSPGPPASGDVRAAVIEECAKLAEGELYQEKYRGKAGHNWWHEKQNGDEARYGNGRHDAAAAIRALSQAPATDANGYGASGLSNCCDQEEGA